MVRDCHFAHNKDAVEKSNQQSACFGHIQPMFINSKRFSDLAQYFGLYEYPVPAFLGISQALTTAVGEVVCSGTICQTFLIGA